MHSTNVCVFMLRLHSRRRSAMLLSRDTECGRAAHQVWVVHVPVELARARLMKRNNLTAVSARMGEQISEKVGKVSE